MDTGANMCSNLISAYHEMVQHLDRTDRALFCCLALQTNQRLQKLMDLFCIAAAFEL